MLGTPRVMSWVPCLMGLGITVPIPFPCFHRIPLPQAIAHSSDPAASGPEGLQAREWQQAFPEDHVQQSSAFPCQTMLKTMLLQKLDELILNLEDGHKSSPVTLQNRSSR